MKNRNCIPDMAHRVIHLHKLERDDMVEYNQEYQNNFNIVYQTGIWRLLSGCVFTYFLSVL